MPSKHHWNGLPDSVANPGRRRVLVLSAAAAASLVAGPTLPALGSTNTPLPLSPAEIVAAVPKARWGWMVELMVLRELPADRARAEAVLHAAIDLDLDPSATWRRKPALRLYDLKAAIGTPADRMALADLVESHSTDAELLARAARWRDPTRARPWRPWRTSLTDGTPLSIEIGPA
jgi:hypothetical protein